MDFLQVVKSSSAVATVRFHAQGRTLSFLGSESHGVVDEENLAGLFRELASDDGGKSTIILSLDAASFSCRELQLPLADRNKVREILPLELKGETAVDTEELVFDTLPLLGGLSLALWGKRAELAQEIEQMTAAGLEPQVVSAAPFHWRYLLPETVEGYTALSDGTALAVFNDRELCSFRALAKGEPFHEIGKTLAALEFGKGVKVSHLFLFGELSRETADMTPPDLGGEVPVAELPITGELAAAFVRAPARAVELAGCWALARAILDGTQVNFRRGALSYTAGFEKVRKKLRITALLATILVLLICAETGIRYYLVKKDVDSLDRSILSIYREVFPGRKKPADAVAELKSEIKQLGGAGTRNLLSTMGKIAQMKGDGISGFYEAEFEGNQVRLKGDGASSQAVNDFKARAGAIFDVAEVGQIKSKADGSVSFTFRGTLREGGK